MAEIRDSQGARRARDVPAALIVLSSPGMDTEELIEALEKGERDGKTVEFDGLRFSSLRRVLWPGDRLTQGDVLRYYDLVADVTQRYLEDRPLHLKNYYVGETCIDE